MGETKNKLQVIVQESGLEQSKAQVLLDNFKDYFQIAADWENKAKMIVVTNADQKAEMQMARTGRLFLRSKRITIENTRKALKEQSLRESKAIDGIANVLKALIIPVEEYLEKQEKFVEIKAAEEAETKRIEEEKKAEEERIAREKAEEEERARIRIENERLKKEAEEREKKMVAERAKAEREQKAQEEKARKERELADKILREEQEKRAIERVETEAKQRAYEEGIRKVKEAAEEVARIERERQEKRIAEEKARAEQALKEKKSTEERFRLEIEEKTRKETEERAKMITCPYCHKTFKREQ